MLAPIKAATRPSQSGTAALEGAGQFRLLVHKVMMARLQAKGAELELGEEPEELFYGHGRDSPPCEAQACDES